MKTKYYHVKYSKAQLKIQQMAFVLVAIVVFFSIVALFYFAINLSGIKSNYESLEEQKTSEMVRKLSGLPELRWEGCSSCVDLDKALLLKNRTSYKGFWGLEYLSVEVVYPKVESRECDKGVYPNCNKITIVGNNNAAGEFNSTR